jgi:tryptophan synthase alpha chain
MADGTTIQRASRAALAQGVSLKWILAELSGPRPRLRAPLLLMSYLNPLLAYGLERLPEDAARAGVSGFIVPDLPFEECADVRAALAARGLALVQLVTPVTPTERIQMLCAASSGFVYAVTMTGTTGKNFAVQEAVLEYFARVKRLSPLPVCAGFGIRSREQVARLAPHVDGVVVASALVEMWERGEDPAAFLRTLR